MKKLCDALIGDIVRVDSVEAVGDVKERLLALGLTRNASVEVIRKGRKDNLTVYNIRGVMIVLRKEEAKFINVT